MRKIKIHGKIKACNIKRQKQEKTYEKESLLTEELCYCNQCFCPGGCGRNFDFLWVRAEICAGEFSENFKDQCGKTERASVDDSGYQLSVSE